MNFFSTLLSRYIVNIITKLCTAHSENEKNTDGVYDSTPKLHQRSSFVHLAATLSLKYMLFFKIVTLP